MRNAISDGEKRLKELEREIFDLQIANRGKDYLIDQLKGERTGFFEKLLLANRNVGQLETKLDQLKELGQKINLTAREISL